MRYTEQVLEIHWRVRGRMLHKHFCCTKIIKLWVAYWFLYQSFHVASGWNSVGKKSLSSLWVCYCDQEKQWALEPQLFLSTEQKSVIYVCVRHLHGFTRYVVGGVAQGWGCGPVTLRMEVRCSNQSICWSVFRQDTKPEVVVALNERSMSIYKYLLTLILLSLHYKYSLEYY